MMCAMLRRTFLQSATSSIAGLTLAGHSSAVSAGVDWEVGCFNRPWTKWSFDEALKEIRAAGYTSTGLLTRTREEPFVSSSATPEYLDALKKRIKSSGLTANMAALHSRHGIPIDASIADLRQQITNARFLGLKYVMSFGTDKPEEFEHYLKVRRDGAAFAQDKGIKLVMKPHGGISGSAAEILHVIKQVNHRNFSIWYDAGNIIYYTGKDPVAEIDGIAPHISGFCAKDCGDVKSDVMIQFGTGKVDFAAVFKKLKNAGFKGPVMVECCKVGETAAETGANAAANRAFLTKIMTTI